MSGSHTTQSKLFLTGTSFAVGYLLKKLLKKVWKKKYNEDPPGEIASEKINWFKLFIWTFLSGLVLRLIKVGIKRTLVLKLKDEDLLME